MTTCAFLLLTAILQRTEAKPDMCGICGIVQTPEAGPVQGALIQAMTDMMQHRGPDGSGVWVAPDHLVGLGHRRLSIVDLSEAGRQPMANSDGSIQVTFNGEIYNFRELRRQLEGKGHRFRSQTDTEVLVYLYEELGDAMIDRLDGDFAFGLWDGRRRRLLLARDRAGVKPLYYTQLENRFLFASEIKALLTHPEVSCRIDETALYHYLTYLVVPPPSTLFQNIMKLPAASMLTVEQHASGMRVAVRRHWEPEFGKSSLSESELDEHLVDLLDRSVKKRLMSDVPVGVLFSGGVDSTLNAGSFGRLVAPEQVRTFNVGVVGAKSFDDESQFAADMAKRLGTDHHQVQMTEDDLLSAVAAIARQQDEPLADPVCVPLYFVTKLARETGTIVLHAGEGADELFCGYSKYQRYLQVYRRLWKPLEKLPCGLHRAAYHCLRGAESRRWRKVADILRRLAQGQGLLLSSSVGFYEHEKDSVLSDGFRRRAAALDSFDVVAGLYNDVRRKQSDASFLDMMLANELQIRLPELLLMRVDKMSMLNSVEVRVPFLDRDLIDFAVTAPAAFKMRGGVLKEPIKRLAAEFVPRELVYRRKSGFGAPIQDWFDSRLGADMREQLHGERAVLSTWFDVAELQRRLEGRQRTGNDAFQLWAIYNFMKWRESFDGAAVKKAA